MAMYSQTTWRKNITSWAQPLHPSLLLRSVSSNVVQIWRKGQQPHFQTLGADEAAFVQHLQAGSSIESTADTLAGTALLPDPSKLGVWLQAWLRDGLLGQPMVEETTEAML